MAGILADLKMDIDTIATGLLHDTMEDCLVTHEDISARFGTEVADLVDGVTKIGKIKISFQRKKHRLKTFEKCFWQCQRTSV